MIRTKRVLTRSHRVGRFVGWSVAPPTDRVIAAASLLVSDARLHDAFHSAIGDEPPCGHREVDAERDPGFDGRDRDRDDVSDDGEQPLRVAAEGAGGRRGGWLHCET